MWQVNYTTIMDSFVSTNMAFLCIIAILTAVDALFERYIDEQFVKGGRVNNVIGGMSVLSLAILNIHWMYKVMKVRDVKSYRSRPLILSDKNWYHCWYGYPYFIEGEEYEEDASAMKNPLSPR